MLLFIGRKLLSGFVLFLIVTAIVFGVLYSHGEDTVRSSLGAAATDGQVHARMADLGLDQSVVKQYLLWLGHLAQGDLGNSFNTGEPVSDMLASRLPVTLSLVLFTTVLTAILSALVGIVAATRGGWLDRTLQSLTVAGVAVPQFLVAIALVFTFAISIPVFPATGYVSPDESLSGWIESLVLPVTAILLGSVAGAAQQFRGTVKDVLERDFVRTLRARGISERAIVYRHVLRNAAGPGLTILALQTIGLLGGAVLIERIFALPGIGDLTQNAALQGDLPAVMGVVLVAIVMLVVVNLVADLLNNWLNPKVRQT